MSDELARPDWLSSIRITRLPDSLSGTTPGLLVMVGVSPALPTADTGKSEERLIQFSATRRQALELALGLMTKVLDADEDHP